METRNVLVDSNIPIDFLRTGSGLWLKLLELQKKGEIELYLSTLTIFELFSGESSRKPEPILDILATCKIIPLSQDIARVAGEMRRDQSPLTTIADLFVAATALQLKARLATRNLKHFQGIPNLKFFSLSS